MKRKKKTKNTETTANNTLEHKLRELGVELNTDATKLNNLSRLLSALISSSPPPGLRRRKGGEDDDDTFKVDDRENEKDEEEKKKQTSHQKGKTECILALEKFFCKRLARGDVEQAKRDLISRKGGGKGGKGENATFATNKEEELKIKYRAWLLKNYKLFVSRMIYVCAKDRAADERTRVVAFSGLMEVARAAAANEKSSSKSGGSHFENEIFERALEECVRSKLWSDATLGTLKKRYLGRVDVQYYAYKAVARIAGRLASDNKNSSGRSKKTKEEEEEGGEEEEDVEATSAEVARNLYDVISNVSVDFEDYDPESNDNNTNNATTTTTTTTTTGTNLTSKEVDFAAMLGLSSEDLAKAAAASKDDDEEAETTPWCRMPSQALDLDEQNEAKRRKKSNEKDIKKKKKENEKATTTTTTTNVVSKISWMDGVKRRRAFSDAWIAFLRLPNFPEDVYRKILARLHLDVIPHHVNPVLLCDFCVSSVNVGGLIGMLALHALFVLVTRHNLEYPKFYDRLYNLINEDSFYANGRRTFFELADVFLKSPALPGYCAAAFCKKFGRLSLSAPPAGAMLCVSFIHNLMRRHPKSCLPLIHRDRDVVGGGGGVNIDNAEEDNTAAERDENVMKRKSSNNTTHRRSFDEDPYDFSTKDPAKSRALESSLWEMTALENHYFPQVTKLVQMLRMDLGDRVKTKEIDISGGGAEAQHSLCSANYYSLLKEELDVRLKSVALKHGTIGDLGLFHSDEFVSAAGFGELIQWKEEEEEDFGR